MRVALFFLLVAAASSLVSCTIANLFFPQIATVSGVQLSRTTLYLVAGGSDGVTGTLAATVLPAGASNTRLTWSSSNPSVAAVDGNGRVSSVHWGDAVITATTVDGGKTAACNVHVTNNFDPAVRTLTTSRFAGSSVGTAGTTDGSSAAALFTSPVGVVSDGTNLYVAADYAVRQVNISSGTVSTLAGTSGTYTNVITDDPAGAGIALFYNLYGLATDGTSLYVADSGLAAIHKISISSPHIVSTVTSALDGNISGMAIVGAALYVAGGSTDVIWKIDLSSSTPVVTVWAGTSSSPGVANGFRTSAMFSNPSGIATDGTNLYIADQGSNLIRKIVIESGNVTTLATLTAAPTDVVTDGVNVYVSQWNSGSGVMRIRLSDGTISATATPGAGFGWPSFGIAIDESHLFVSGQTGNNVWQIQ